MPGLRGHPDPPPQVASGHPVTKDHLSTGEEAPGPAGAVSRVPGLGIDLMTAREVEAIKVMPGARQTQGEGHPGVHLGGHRQCPHPGAGQTERPAGGQEPAHQPAP